MWERLDRRRRKRRQIAYQADLARSGWYDPSARSDQPAIFIGGSGRSGTTLFREMLNRHPQISSGPETSLFGLQFNVMNQAVAWSIDPDELRRLADDSPNLVAYAETFQHRYLLERTGKARWADKTPNNVRALPKILAWFPKGRFIHVIRDGRDVVCSLRNHPKERVIDGVVVPVESNNPIAKCATRWFNDVSGGLAFRSHPRCLEVRYEDMVADPEPVFRRVCEFLEEDYDPLMLSANTADAEDLGAGRLVNNANATQPIKTSRLARWRRDLSAAERQDFVNVAGELLVTCGYVDDHSWMDE